MLQIIFLVMTLTGFAAPLDFPWEWYSDPGIMAQDLEKKFDRLPRSGSLPESRWPWSGDYWALRKGNINYRWKAHQPRGFELRSPTREEALRMSLAELSHLSPAEKYDLFLGRYDYPLKAEVSRLANPAAYTWEGICHGVAPASLNHREPFAKGARNPDGILIPFGSADIKALLSYYYAHGFYAPNHQMGRRCYGSGGEDCDEDLNAGAFHIVLANKLGLRKEGFILDIQRGPEVWNHPVAKFTSEILGESSPISTSAPGTTKRMKVRTRARVILGTDNYWSPVIGTNGQKEATKNYEYYIELDSQGQIIGGDWISKERPDFLWVKHRPREFQGSFQSLAKLLND